MDFSDLLRYGVPLAAVAGFTWGLIQQAFKFAWKLQETNLLARENREEIGRVEEEAIDRHDQVVELLKPMPRIEAAVNQLMDDRRLVR